MSIKLLCVLFLDTVNGTQNIDAVVSETDMAVIAREYLANWESLRPHLGLSRPKETSIRNSFPGNYEQQKQECLSVWQEMNGDRATYRALVTAAESARNQQLADKVKALVSGMYVHVQWEGKLIMCHITYKQAWCFSVSCSIVFCILSTAD